MSPRRAATLAVAASTVVFTAVLIWWIQHRTALTMDELHSALLGRAVAAGEPLSFYDGSVTRYEGGSWLIGFPVGLFMLLGAGPVAATSWTAGLCAVIAATLASWWVARTAGPGRALWVGPLLAASPELMHYSFRAWGSISEALFMLPLIALVAEPFVSGLDGARDGGERSPRGGRRFAWAIGLGALLGAASILSYVHFVTAITFAVVLAVSRRDRLGRAVLEILCAAATALVSLVVWNVALNPYPAEALSIRDGKRLDDAVWELFAPDLVRVVGDLPGAVIGEHLAATPVRTALALGVLLCAAAGVVLVGRRGGAGRAALVFAALYCCALGVGHTVTEPPDVYRYYLPLLFTMAVVIASAGAKVAAPALLLGAALFWPEGLPMPYQTPQFTHVELGGNAMHRWTRDPHRKFFRLLRGCATWEQPWFAFGYGVDSGQRYHRTITSMRETLAQHGDPEAERERDPHFHLSLPRRWIEGWDGLGFPEAEQAFFFGLGIGLISDGGIDQVDVELLDAHTTPRRLWVLEGVGAGLRRAHEKGRPAPAAWDAGLVAAARSGDYEAIAQGIAEVGAGTVPDPLKALVPVGPRAEEWAKGLSSEVDLRARAMVRVPMVPTP